MNSTARLIITADDFGRDAFCTSVIADCLASRAITATSLMANGSHFDEACRLVRTRGLAGRIGVHLSLDEGPALSREMLSFCGPDGQLKVRRTVAPFGRTLSRAVESELASQIERVIGAGIEPTHLDSHRHIHTAFPIGRLVARLARRFRIPYVRPARNLAGRSRVGARFYKWAFNRYLALQVQTADHFGDIVDFYRRPDQHGASGLIECMTHLDDSPRGHENLQLLTDEGFLTFVKKFQLVGHAEARR